MVIYRHDHVRRESYKASEYEIGSYFAGVKEGVGQGQGQGLRRAVIIVSIMV